MTVNYVDAIKSCLFWNQEAIYAIATVKKNSSPRSDDFAASGISYPQIYTGRTGYKMLGNTSRHHKVDRFIFFLYVS